MTEYEEFLQTLNQIVYILLNLRLLHFYIYIHLNFLRLDWLDLLEMWPLTSADSNLRTGPQASDVSAFWSILNLTNNMDYCAITHLCRSVWSGSGECSSSSHLALIRRYLRVPALGYMDAGGWPSLLILGDNLTHF